MSTQQDILEGASGLFMQYGLKSVTMDDIARKVGVSKKTIYQFYKDKEAIISDGVKAHFENQKDTILTSLEGSNSAVEALFKISKCMKTQIETINPSALYDLQKYYPKIYKIVADFKKTFMLEILKNILIKGIKEKTFRPEIDVEILAVMRIEQVQLAFDTEVFPRDKFSFVKVNLQLFDHFVQGLLTEKGREIYNKFLKDDNEAL